MKLVIAIVRPEKLNDVLESLFRADVRGLRLDYFLVLLDGNGGRSDVLADLVAKG